MIREFIGRRNLNLIVPRNILRNLSCFWERY